MLKWQDKIKGKEKMIILLCVGIVLVLSFPQNPGTVKETTTKEETTINNRDYEMYLEDKLERSLTKIKGLGKVCVIVKTKDNGEKIVKSDVVTNKRSEDESNSDMKSSTSEVSVSEEVIMEKNDNKDAPYVTSIIHPKIEGVVIIAKGGDDPIIKSQVISAIEALFSIPSHKIVVLKME